MDPNLLAPQGINPTIPIKRTMDTMAAMLRGGVTASLGAAGDIEGLGRMGINYFGGNVNPKSVLPNTEYFSDKLPPLNPISGDNDMKIAQSMGEFLPLPGAISLGSKGLAMAKQLRKVGGEATSAPLDMSRRDAMKKTAAVGATTAVAPHLVAKALAEMAPAAEAGIVRSAAAPIATGAARVAANLSASAMAAALRKSGSHLGEIGRVPKDLLVTLDPADLAKLERFSTNPDDFVKIPRWMDYHVEGGGKGARNWDSAGAAAQEDRAIKFLKTLTDKEVFDVVKQGPRGTKLPQSWVDNGVVKQDIANRLFPVNARYSPRESELDSFSRIGTSLGGVADHLTGQAGRRSTSRDLANKLASLGKQQNITFDEWAKSRSWSAEGKATATPQNFRGFKARIEEDILSAQKRLKSLSDAEREYGSVAKNSRNLNFQQVGEEIGPVVGDIVHDPQALRKLLKKMDDELIESVRPTGRWASDITLTKRDVPDIRKNIRKWIKEAEKK